MTEEKIKINIEEENETLKAEVLRLGKQSQDRLMIMRRLESFANDINNLMNLLRADFEGVQTPVDEQQGEEVE
tara:strand:+ start:739 stop:957 length:219 start_codon:yes stop_codon:yes gene_type:complete